MEIWLEIRIILWVTWNWIKFDASYIIKICTYENFFETITSILMLSGLCKLQSTYHFCALKKSILHFYSPHFPPLALGIKHDASLEFVVSFEIFFRTKFLSFQRWYWYWKIFRQNFKLEVAAFLIEYSPRRFLSTLFWPSQKVYTKWSCSSFQQL